MSTSKENVKKIIELLGIYETHKEHLNFELNNNEWTLWPNNGYFLFQK